jgi:DNA invertase Pin-like site-specific DNA recombinase
VVKAVAYLRVSTSDQSTDSQLDAIQGHAVPKGLEIVQVFEDEGISGARRSRPALDQMMASVRHGEAQAVIVYKIDRLGRSMYHLVNLVDELGRLGVDLVSVTEPHMDTTTPSGKMLFGIMASMAEYERSLIAERVRAGMASAKKRGKRVGRPKAVLSRTQLRSLKEQGLSNSEVARLLKVSRPTLIRELQAMGL